MWRRESGDVEGRHRALHPRAHAPGVHPHHRQRQPPPDVRDRRRLRRGDQDRVHSDVVHGAAEAAGAGGVAGVPVAVAAVGEEGRNSVLESLEVRFADPAALQLRRPPSRRCAHLSAERLRLRGVVLRGIQIHCKRVRGRRLRTFYAHWLHWHW
eukprot:CAMPEP_0113676640 /NCGR_PEP_ID=MMETSP0038_2-20120614/8762_1 /TAXON_ID=2898 /ORGANISM="Cryptomonas paramecium" /LENGTH=153 /DNA_ID=CAMNT_0000593705 /DNA_START=344 /DNA_END=805 /DNA_ORIENTATION=+ /assembly_acc=CAM_ASM_000170